MAKQNIISTKIPIRKLPIMKYVINRYTKCTFKIVESDLYKIVEYLIVFVQTKRNKPLVKGHHDSAENLNIQMFIGKNK